MERRFHSPYRYWFRGLAIELAVIAGFVVLLAMLAVLVVRVVG